MKILAHRGFWKEAKEKNSKQAFTRALQSGFGIETDIRNHGKELWIAHDPEDPLEMSLRDFLVLCAQHKCSSPLGLNIKVDGIAKPLREILAQFPSLSYFCFDASIPESLRYFQNQLSFFVRRSEYEESSPLWEKSSGIWLDQFNKDWLDEKELKKLLQAKKPLCIVSPDLHGRPHLPFWNDLKKWRQNLPSETRDLVWICTDIPEECREIFQD